MNEILKLKGDSFEVNITLNTPLAVIVRDIFYEGDWEAMEADLGKNISMKKEMDTCRTIEENVVQLGEEIYKPVSFPELKEWLNEMNIKIDDMQHISLNGLYDLALDYADRGLYDVAYDIINFMLDFDPNYAPAYELKGSLLLEEGKIEEGLVYLDKAIEIDPWLIEAYSSLGEGYYNLGEYNKAAYYWEKEIEKAPENKLTYFMIADAYEKLGEHQRAIDILSRLLHRDPESILALYEIKEIYEKIGDFERAKEMEEKIASMKPKYTSDLEVWTKVMLKRGEYKKVMKVLEEKMKTTNLNTHIKLLLVIPYIKLGLKDKAREILEEIKDNNVWYYYGKKELFNEFLSEEEMKECEIVS
jgi:tetratricopeptide (TPR) repeat protein